MRRQSFILLCLSLLLLTACFNNEAEPTFSIQTGEDITIAYEAGSEVTVHFTSSREWQATSADDWFTISPSSGESGTFNLVITTKTDNLTAGPRTSIITLTSGSLTKDIPLQQSNAITLEQETYYVEAEGGDLDIPFSTNVKTDELRVYSDQNNWLQQRAKNRTTFPLALRLKVSPNTEKFSRTTYIYFIKEADTNKKILSTVTIIQKGTNAGQSVDYSADKTVSVLQTAEEGNGIPIVIMGDGFIDKEITDGTYA